MENLEKGVNLICHKYQVDGRDYFSMLYRATESIDEANEVLNRYIAARKEMRKKDLDGFEAEVTSLEKIACQMVENHPRKLQEWEADKANAGILKLFFKGFDKKPDRPSEEATKIYKRVTDKRAELNSLLANPLLQLDGADGAAMLKAIVEELEAKGFKVKSREAESNGDWTKETIVLTK